MKVVVSKTMQRGALSKFTGLCKASGIPLSMAEPKAIEAMAEGVNHQGVVAVIAPSTLIDIGSAVGLLPKPPLSALAVLLDHVQDPHNLGAMIRSAEAAAASFVAFPLRRSSLPTGVVSKTSAGASLRLPLSSTGNVAEAVRELKENGLWAVGLDAGAKKSIYADPLPKRVLLVVGGEGKGLGRTTAGACDEILGIPTQGVLGSLNASVALALAMFEWARINRMDTNES
jgi:23S rRNA (guanosine2251-2'-O)-methyltransferase